MFKYMKKKCTCKKRVVVEEEEEDPNLERTEVSPDWPVPTRPKETYANGQTFPKKLNDSVFELYAPETRHQVDIVFFHGLQIGTFRYAYIETWKSGTICWPQEWLPLDFPKARILSISYDSSASRSKEEGHEGTGQVDLPKLGEILVEDVIVSAGVGRNCPVILVGHSLGGIVIKQLCLEADKIQKAQLFGNKEIKKFMKHIRGIFYYSVPHGGSQLANVAKNYIIRAPGPMLEYLTVLSTHTEGINEEFVKLRQSRRWSTAAASETLITRIGPFGALVVTEESASRDADSFHLIHADHITICKPRDTRATAYVLLKDFILEHVPR